MSRSRLRPLATPLASGGGVLLLAALYAYVSFVLPDGADVMRHSSGIYDMDVSRVVMDLTTGVPALRPSVHPLQKLLAAPLGHFFNTRLFGGLDRLGAAKLLIGISMTLYALTAGALAYQLAQRALLAGLAGGLLCGVSFSSLLAASIPESAALSSLGAVLPLVFLNARLNRSLSWGEAAAWGGLAVLCLAFTVTQLAHWAIALGVRLALRVRSARGSVAGELLPKAALIAALAVGLTWAGVRLQSHLYPKTRPFHASDLLESERPYLRFESLRAAPLRHAARLAAHFLLYDFVAPFPAYSDFLVRDYGLDYWSLSIEEASWEQWRPAQRALAAAWLFAVFFACTGYRRADVRFLAPTLAVVSQFALHLAYGREYILYSPNWHAVLVALLVAAAWNGLERRRWTVPAAALLLATAMLVNGLVVMKAVYGEVAAGLQVGVRDERGNLLLPPTDETSAR